jgi:ribosomal protein S18 acetylase RimI-like enzyme
LTDDLVIAPVDNDGFEALLPLIADYQCFYGVAAPDESKNRSFFARFLGTSDAGCILAAHRGEELVGYVCLYFSPSSVEAEDIVILNDLYVVPEARGSGVGRQLIDATTALARRRPVRLVRWSTAIDNRRAQRLYEQMGAERTTWFEYEVNLDPSDR